MPWSQVPTFLRDKDTGQIYMNPAKDWVQPFELSVSKPNQIIQIPAGGRAGPFPLTAQYDGPIEAFYVKANVYAPAEDPTQPGALLQTYDVDFLLEHPGKRIQFSNRIVPLLGLSGNAAQPYVLPETIFIPPVQSLNLTLYNNDLVNAVFVEFVLGGIKFYPNMAPAGAIKEEVWKYVDRRERTYAYFQTTDEPVVLTGLQKNIFFMTIPDNSDFECFKLSQQSTGAFRCLIRDGQNDRALTGADIHRDLLFGGHAEMPDGAGGFLGSGGIWPARWASSWLIRRSTKVQLDLTDLTGSDNTIKPVFAGRKISYVS